MEFRIIYFIVTFLFGIIAYSLNWNSLINIDPNCSKDVIKISNNLLFTSSIVLIVLSCATIFKTNNDIKFYPVIFLIISLVFLVLSITNLINGKQTNNPPTTNPPTTTPIITQTLKPIITECVSIIVSVFNLIIGIILGIFSIFSIYYLKNQIF